MLNQIRNSLLVLSALLAISACDKPQENKPEVKQDVDFQPGKILVGTLPEISRSLANGEVTSEQLVTLYLKRIDMVDRAGPNLQSVLSINPDAMAEAQRLDKLRQSGEVLGPLHGIPILLKDNIESIDKIPTTAGALALKENYADTDSPLVAGLRKAGAIILGKTNLSQWANFRSEDSMSGWSALGGQVRNPHVLSRNPCGSSSGSGAAAAASLASGTVGTETNGSIICPSNVNGIVGFKPTVGVVSQSGIIPISVTQDTAGPMTKSVEGAALMMNAMASTETDYTALLKPGSLKGVRVGVVRFASASYQPINDLFEAALKDLVEAGAILVDINDRPATPENYSKHTYDLLKYEFKDGLNKYLATTDPAKVTTRTLAEVIEFNKEHADIEMALFNQSIFDKSEQMDAVTSEGYLNTLAIVLKTNREEGIDFLMSEHNVQVLVSPSGVLAPAIDPVNGDVWPGGWPGIGSYAARAGYPHATVPMGTFRHLPVGISFVGGANQDANILGYAYAYEQQSMKRATPRYLPTVDMAPEIKKAMRPHTGK